MSCMGVTSCGNVDEKLPVPIQPDVLFSDLLNEDDNSFSLSGFSWYLSKEDAEKKMEDYKLILDEDQQSIYLAEGKLKDQTPFIQWVALFFSKEEELVSVSVSYYVEETGDDKLLELADSLETYVREVGEGEEVETDYENVIVYKKASGSELGVGYYKDVKEALGVEWQDFDEVKVVVGCPMDRVELILEEKNIQ